MSIILIQALALVAATATDQPGESAGPEPEIQVIEGPTLICGEAFALRLAAGERARYQEGPGAQMFEVESLAGPFLIYEGNDPHPDGEIIRTGRGAPSVIALHHSGGSDARTRRSIRERLVIGRAHARLCSGPSSER